MDEFLKKLILEKGPIDVGQYMALVLGHPTLGYYMKQDPFGTEGDFITAPEISQMFGEMIAAWILDVWQQMGAPKFNLVECGPGRGTLMADIMRSLKNVPDFPEACSVHLMEMSPVLKALQAQNLKDYEPKWHKDFDTISDGPMIVIANEFLDALPVRQMIKTQEGWDECVVEVKEDKLEFGTRPLPFNLPVEAKVGQVFEVSPVRSLFISNLVKKMNHGAALIIDYGHTETGVGDTLQAVRQHKYISPLEDVGNADITTHVDFAAVKVAAGDAFVSGPVEQGAFLKAIGIEHRAQTLKAKASEAQKFEIEKALQRLTDSSQMGSLFKVMGISNGQALNLPGF